ncbi:hypothetical protein PGT21_001139 [Puccinia graminis f. sp. tritici]|uniref:Uncharacterized protein n=1 Tax=Puccinia graminis f. sp. tritici TaxID=56615 RepID=A0A5B0PWL6_PUCGR|nr:hypothetical protein PGT21_001139 [Puccinia graminis f. sp. tritici]
MHHRFPQPACVASAPRAFRISATSILRAPKQTGQSFGPLSISPRFLDNSRRTL